MHRLCELDGKAWRAHGEGRNTYRKGEDRVG